MGKILLSIIIEVLIIFEKKKLIEIYNETYKLRQAIKNFVH